MTVCAVHVFEKDIFMGADGLLSNKYDIIDENFKKIHYINKGTDTELMYSIAGSNGMIAAFVNQLPHNYNGSNWLWDTKENHVECLTDFIDLFIEKYAKVYPDEPLHCLIACKKHFCCHKVVQHSVREIKTNQYAAIGCGDDLAMGALYSGGTIITAIEAACKHSLHCGGTCQTCSMQRNY